MNGQEILVAPSLLAADFSVLAREIEAVQDAGADLLHCDVMDGHFVRNITFGPFILEAVRKCARVPLDVHLMLSHPLSYINQFADAGADTIIVHAECSDPLEDTVRAIRDRRCRAGVTVNPDKPVDLLLPHLASIDQVLIMTVFAGFGGQEFIAGAVPKIRTIYDAVRAQGLQVDIEVDGGINGETALTCAANGARIFAAGNYIFHSTDYAGRIRNIRKGAQSGRGMLQQGGPAHPA
jgi:ribulose-phosphate 3-epimerase